MTQKRISKTGFLKVEAKTTRIRMARFHRLKPGTSLQIWMIKLNKMTFRVYLNSWRSLDIRWKSKSSMNNKRQRKIKTLVWRASLRRAWKMTRWTPALRLNHQSRCLINSLSRKEKSKIAKGLEVLLLRQMSRMLLLTKCFHGLKHSRLESKF